jgi:DNA-directed RNA polymerase subunit RPC12/RpoP
MVGKCLNCGTEFNLWRQDRKFCCPECKDSWHIRERREAIEMWRKIQAARAAFLFTGEIKPQTGLKIETERKVG